MGTDASDGAPLGEGGQEAWSPRDLRSTVGTMAFNEPMNDGFDKSIVPTWSSAGILATVDGHLMGTISTTYAGPMPPADHWRDVLFWNVSGVYPAGQDAQTIDLAPVTGIIASSSDARGATFALGGSFDPTVRSATGDRPFEIDVGLTWVRVYRQSGALSFQVMAGGRQAISADKQLTWEGTPQRLEGPFGYYEPLLEDTPGLGASFNYPVWIRAHVTW